MDNFRSLLVVDCQYDFINGTLGCRNAEAAVVNTTLFINTHQDLHVMYSMDWHPEDHCSFAKNGGMWPAHCVRETKGSNLHEAFFKLVTNHVQRPCSTNMYYKGVLPDQEEYSAFNAKCSETGHTIAEDSSHSVMICGLASEFCVRDTTLELLEAGHEVTLLTDAIGWINEVQHFEIIKYLESKGAVSAKSRP